ncbi:hypothetical protein BDV93DRAFT_518038 [Ceratobasidium sp. AG-I]|nr:hypothetical protein BDV93DRAFT_518038 [Ceratobasidium sp. AG-I]
MGEEEVEAVEGGDETGEGESVKLLDVSEGTSEEQSEVKLEARKELIEMDELEGLDVDVDDLEGVGLEWDEDSEETFYGIVGLLDIDQLVMGRCKLSNWDL